jgi:hypothetical protein
MSDTRYEMSEKDKRPGDRKTGGRDAKGRFAPGNAFTPRDRRRTPEMRLAERAEKAALAAAATEIKQGIEDALHFAPLIIARMAERALDPKASDKTLLAFGDRINSLAQRLVELEVERLRPASNDAGVQVHIGLPSPAEVVAQMRLLSERYATVSTSRPKEVLSLPEKD